jgi:Rod binding domain-containing protein
MTAAISNVLQSPVDANRQPNGAHSSATVAGKSDSAEDPRLKEAAAQFEAVLLRQMLQCLEKTTNSSTTGQSSGGSIYGSMVVNTVADAVARAGGLGLASVIAKSVHTPAALDASALRKPASGESLHAAGQTDLSRPELTPEVLRGEGRTK